MPEPGRICVGIPTVYREQDYLKQCVDSLVANASSPSTYEILVMDFTEASSRLVENGDPAWPAQVRFEKYEGEYPALDGLPANFGDSPDRVRWRSKQCFDAGQLLQRASMTDCRYYLHMEDDILAPPNWDSIVLGAVTQSEPEWACNGPPM